MTRNDTRWSDAELLELMREHAPQGVSPEAMLPVMRTLVANGRHPLAVVDAVKTAGIPAVGADTPGAAAPPHPGRAAANQRPSRRVRLRRAGFIALWLVIWEVADRIVDNRLMLAGPIRTAQALFENAADAGFWLASGASFGRISLGFAAALVCGIALSLIAHHRAWFSDLLSPVMSVMKTIPMVSFIIMLLIWVGDQALTPWLVLLVVLPFIYVSMSAGLNAVSPRDIERAWVFRLSRSKRFWYLYRPAFMPFLISACRIGLGMSWRAGIMAEVFATTPLSIGKEMFTAKTFLDTPSLFAWTVVVMVLSLVFERLVLALLRWLSRPFGGLLGRSGS